MPIPAPLVSEKVYSFTFHTTSVVARANSPDLQCVPIHLWPKYPESSYLSQSQTETDPTLGYRRYWQEVICRSCPMRINYTNSLAALPRNPQVTTVIGHLSV